jgi:hypothetical protein
MLKNTPFKRIILMGLGLFLIGGIGLLLVFALTLPTLGPRWLFFFFSMLTICGAAVPCIAYLHRRFPSEPPVSIGVILRQSIWIGIYGNLAVWLQLGRVLDGYRAIFLAIGFISIETLLRLIERSRFRVKDVE